MIHFRLLGLMLLGAVNSFSQQAETAFRIPEKDLIPEGIAYDSGSNTFFVSSINKKKIVRIDPKRKISDFISSGQDSIGEVLGLKIKAGKLWACSNADGKSMIHQFDVASGRLIRKWVLESHNERHLFNDLAVIGEGEAFTSDSDAGAVFHVSEALVKPELWVKDNQLRDINGIALLNRDFIVVNASIGFYKISLTTKKISTLPFPGYYPLGIDGLSKYKQSLIGIQNVGFPFSINQYFLNPTADEIKKAKVLVTNHPKFNIPTTGTITGNWFYFVANSQLTNYENGKIKDPSKLEEVLIMRVKLD